MDWVKSAQSKNAERLIPGVHEITVVRILWEKKDGPEYVTKTGEPSPKLVCEDQDGRQGLMTMALSEKAGWTMARLLSCAGANLEAMNTRGVTIESFHDRAFAEKQLIGRKFRASVALNTQGYADITPIKAGENPPDIDAHATQEENDIPFDFPRLAA